MKKIGRIKFQDFTKEVRVRKKLFDKALDRVLFSGEYILGSEVRDFEDEFSQYIGSKYCIGVANGTEAIQISLMALNIGQDDEVITTPLSAVATTLAILAVGATPIFVDTDHQGLIDGEQIEKHINSRTKAIMPVHLYGQAIDLNAVLTVCKKYKIFLIEDACQAHGSLYKGKKLGAFGSFGCFSFYPTKNLGTFGDGGAIVTNNMGLADICRRIRNYGQSYKYKHLIYGLSSRLDEIHAALLRVKMNFLDSDNSKRREIAKIYISKLSKLRDVEIVTRDLENCNFHLFVIRVKRRNELKDFLREFNIETLIHYPTIIPDQPFMKSGIGMSLPNAKKFVTEILSLPCNPFMEISQVDLICQKIAQFMLT